MPISWLHLSDLGFEARDSYQADVARDALIDLVGYRTRDAGLPLDFIVVSGDLAASGQTEEYVAVEAFIGQLAEAAGFGGRKERIIVVPGDRDVAVDHVRRLRRLSDDEESAWFFGPEGRRDRARHFEGQEAFRAWHDRFFAGVGRRAPDDTTCSEIVTLAAGRSLAAILPINTALFAVDDDDHDRLWIGLRALRPAASALAAVRAELRLAVMHHPPNWLAPAERALALDVIAESADLILHGHERQPIAEVVRARSGNVLRLAVGPCVGGSSGRSSALFATLADEAVSLEPQTYASRSGRWVVDTSIFPDAPGFRKVVPMCRGGAQERTTSRLRGGRRQLFPGRRVVEHPADLERRLLTVYGEVRGDQIAWRYLVHDEERPVEFAVIGGLDEAVGKAKRWLDAPSDAATLDIGQTLGVLLLGDLRRPGFQRLLRLLFRRPEAAADLLLGPSCGPVRCRIVTVDRRLRRLPWSLLALDGHYLADDGWTFEFAEPSTSDGSAPHIHLTGPCTTLVITPRVGPDTVCAERHEEELDELFARIWPLEAKRGRLPHYRLRARTRAEIDAVLRVHTPQVVYILGQVYASDDPPQLRVDGHAGSEIVDLRALCAHLTDTRVLFLNAVGSDLEALASTPLPGPSCVIVPFASTDAALAPAVGLAWIEALLRRGHSPVSALDTVLRERSDGRAVAMIARTCYRSWRTTVAPTEDFVGKAAAYLDRTAQRTHLYEKVLDLVHNLRRVLSVIAPSPPDQHPDGLSELLHGYVHDQIEPHKIRLFREQLILPSDGEGLDARIERRITRDLLAMDAGDDLQHALARYVERGARRLGLAPGTRCMLWIEWRLGEREAAVSSTLLESWLRFGAEILAPQCPPNLQIVSLLTVVASAKGCTALENHYMREVPVELAACLSSTRSGYVVLPQPGDVGLHDIDDYLHRHSSCRADLVATVSAQIFSRTRGNYNDTIAAIAEIERSGTWLSLAAVAPHPRTTHQPRIFR